MPVQTFLVSPDRTLNVEISAIIIYVLHLPLKQCFPNTEGYLKVPLPDCCFLLVINLAKAFVLSGA